MSESDTPRSDRWEKQYDDWADKSLFRPSTVTTDEPDGWDRCRELERENARLREALEQARWYMYNAFEPNNQSSAYKAENILDAIDAAMAASAPAPE